MKINSSEIGNFFKILTFYSSACDNFIFFYAIKDYIWHHATEKSCKEILRVSHTFLCTPSGEWITSDHDLSAPCKSKFIPVYCCQ